MKLFKSKKILAIVIVLIIVAFLLLVITLQNTSKYFAYTNNDIYLVNLVDNSEINITNSKSIESNFGSLKFMGDNLLFIQCKENLFETQNNCNIKKYDINLQKINTVLEMNINDYLPNSVKILSENSLLVNSRNKAFLVKDNFAHEILSWNTDLNVGVGGNLCNGFDLFNQQPKYFSFCYSSALLTDIQGSLFIFDINGNKIKEIIPDNKKVPGISFNKFISSNEIVYLDASKLYKYNISADKKEEILNNILNYQIIDDQFIKLIKKDTTKYYDIFNNRLIDEINSYCNSNDNCRESLLLNVARN